MFDLIVKSINIFKKSNSNPKIYPYLYGDDESALRRNFVEAEYECSISSSLELHENKNSNCLNDANANNEEYIWDDDNIMNFIYFEEEEDENDNTTKYLDQKYSYNEETKQNEEKEVKKRIETEKNHKNPHDESAQQKEPRGSNNINDTKRKWKLDVGFHFWNETKNQSQKKPKNNKISDILSFSDTDLYKLTYETKKLHTIGGKK
jgi:hypothetical protein